jgi:phospholysine phosphohistidine inorganic pyrophosphate phosphatase
MPEFDGLDTSNPNCVVVGDAAEHFSYENVNKAFNELLGMSDPILISMGKGRYYQEKGQLVIDLGAYATALEYATDTKATVIGKPAEKFFMAALAKLNCSNPEDAVMIGDDLNSDVGGAQKLNIRGIQVRTGKFRPGRDDCHPTIKPDAIVDNLLGAINLILQTNQTNSVQ